LRQIGSSVTVLDGIELEQQGFQFVSDALRQVPGVQIVRSGGPGQISSIFMRGEASYRTLVLIDGLEISDVAAPQTSVNLANVLLNDVERIEVIRGPQAMLYGADAIGGVINILTRRGQEGVHASGWIQYGSFNTINVASGVSGRIDMFDFNINAQFYHTKGFSAKEDDLTLLDKDGSENISVFAILGFEPSEKLRLEGVFRYTDAETEFDGFSFDPDRKLFTEEIGTRLSAKLDSFDGRVTNKLAISRYQSNREDFRAGAPTLSFFGDPISRFDGERNKIEFLSNIRANENHSFLIGVDYETEQVKTDALDDKTHMVGTYAEWQASFADQLFLTGGLRFDRHKDFGDKLSYRVTGALVRNLMGTNETKLRASFGSGFRAPSLFEQARNVAAVLPPLEEETSRAWDIGIEQAFLDGLGRAEVTYFRQTIDNEIRFDNVGFTGFFQASGKGTSKGIEALLSFGPVGGFSVKASYTYTDSEVNSPDAEDGLPRLRRPKHMTNVNVSYGFWQDRATLNAQLRTAAKTEDGFSIFRVKLDDYAVVDLSASVRLTDRVELHARIDNVFNAQYQEVAGFQASDVAVYGGIRLRL